MNWLLEDPTPIVFCCLLVEAALLVALIKTGRGLVVAAIVGVLALMLAALAVEALVVTERERVEQTLDRLAAALKANDQAAVLAELDPAAIEVRGRAEWALSRVTIKGVKIRDLAIRINRLISPPTARAELLGLIEFKDRLGEVPYQNIVRRFSIQLVKPADRWLIASYEERDFREQATPRAQ